MIWFVCLHSFSFSPQNKPVIRYFTYPSGYKCYCQSGKDFHPPAPSVCPFCGSDECLHGHGWYKRVELVASYEKDYGAFYIYRYLCTASGKTISMHPEFCAAYKRYLLEYVITLLEEHLLNDSSLYSLCRKHHVYKRTLKRWRKRFLADETVKRICFLPHSTAPPGMSYLKELFKFFITSGNGIAAQGAASGLARLCHTFSRSLY